MLALVGFSNVVFNLTGMSKGLKDLPLYILLFFKLYNV